MDNPPPLDAIRAKLADPGVELEAKRAAVSELMAYRNDPAAGALLDELVARSSDSPTLWLLARAYGYLGDREKIPALVPLLDHADHQVRVNAFKSVVALDHTQAVAQARRLVLEGSVALGLELAGILVERCGKSAPAALRQWMFAEEAPLRVASIMYLNTLEEEEFVEVSVEMLRRERKKSMVKVLRKQLVARVGKEHAKTLRKLRAELLFKLENVQLALRQLNPVPDPQSTLKTPADLAALLGIDPGDVSQLRDRLGASIVAGAGERLPSIDEAPAPPAAEPGSRPPPSPEEMEGKFSHDGMVIPEALLPPPPEPKSRIQRTLNRLIGRPLFKPGPADRRGPDRRQADASGYGGPERRARDRRAREADEAWWDRARRAGAVALAAVVGLVALAFRDGGTAPDPTRSASVAADSPLGNVGGSVDVTGEITAVDLARDMLMVKGQQGNVLEVHAPGGRAAAYAPGQTIKVLGVIRQIRPDSRVLVLAFTIVKV